MDQALEFLKGFNIQTILSLGVVVWWFTKDIKTEMKLLEAKIDTQAGRTDRLYEMFIDLIKEGKK
jgi:hypothetical protein